MTMRLPFAVAALILIPAGIAPTVAADFAMPPTSLPRYKFTVGEELQYSEEFLSVPLPGDAPNKPQYKHEGHWHVWVLGKNADGSYRLLIRHHIRLLRLEPKEKPFERFANQILAYCDLFPDGRFVPNVTLGDNMNFAWKIDPQAIWIPLPPDSNALKSGWTTKAPIGKRRFHCSIDGKASAPGLVQTIDYREEGPLDDVEKQTITRRFEFNVATGRQQGYQEEYRFEEFRKPRHFRRVVKLESAAQKPLPWIQTLQRESEKFFAIKADFDKRLKASSECRTVKEYRAQFARVRELVVAEKKSGTTEPIQEQYALLLKSCDTEEKWGLDNVAAAEKTYASPPIDWELKDLEGKTHRSKDYRGKVVILDYWYRSCSWCVLALPQVKQLSEKYHGQEVAVLGMNTDPEEGDAKFVIQKLNLKYPNLRTTFDTRIYKEATSGFPTLLILDRSGRVRDIHRGYSDDLAKRVSETVDQLLKERPQGN